MLFAGDMEWSRQEALRAHGGGGDAPDSYARAIARGARRHLQRRRDLQSQVASDPEYLLYVIFGSDPARADELFEAVWEELAWLRDGGEQDYLDTAKELLRTPREEQLRDNSFWLNQIEAAVQRDAPFTETGGFDEWLDALTLEDVAAAARRYLMDDRYVRVVLFPEDS